MDKITDIIGGLLLIVYALSWTNVYWHLTGYKWMTMWYWIAYFGGGNV